MKNINSYSIVSIYNFIEIRHVFKFKNHINKILHDYEVKGIILIAPEGFNMNISILTLELHKFLNQLKKIINFDHEDLKLSSAYSHIYRKLKVKIKKEILTTRNATLRLSNNKTGKYINPNDWESFINDEDVILIDTRNDYEVQVGKFKPAINPKCKDFTEILKWISDKLLKKRNIKSKRIAMYCTGGIRCEKASSFIKNLGHNEVYQLKGGILNYFSKNKIHSSWEGECFVFDNRVSVTKNLNKGSYDICYACRMPLSKLDKLSYTYVKGISCLYCYGNKNYKQIKKYTNRQKQLTISNKCYNQ